MKTLFLVPVLGVIFLGGCTERQAAALSDTEKASSIASIQKMRVSTPIIARGRMVEKCPIAGCWFKLHDRTGIIKVDLKATKQTVINVPLNAEVTVRGKVISNGSEKIIQAVSATF